MSHLSRRAILGGMIAGTSASALPVRAAAPSTSEQILLWPNGVPAAIPANLQQQYIDRPLDNGLSNRMLVQVTAPFMERFAATTPANGASILIMAGGGLSRHGVG